MKRQLRQCSRVGRGIIQCGTGGFIRAQFTGKIKFRKGKKSSKLRDRAKEITFTESSGILFHVFIQGL